jgi:pilus assembly protein CpaF
MADSDPLLESAPRRRTAWVASWGGSGNAGGLREPSRPAGHQDRLHASEGEIQEIRGRIHRQLLERLNLSSLAQRDRDEAEGEVGRIVRQMLASEMAPLNMEERELVVEQILYEIFGLGPLEPLLKDDTISDILVNTWKQVFVEKNGRIEPTDVTFRNDQHLLQVIDRIVSAVGRRIDDSSPMVDARLADGSRVNAIIPPLSIDGPHLSIRKFRRDVLSADQLVEYGSITPKMVEFLRGCVKARLNILISGVPVPVRRPS